MNLRRILCRFGVHRWPRWTKRNLRFSVNSIGDTLIPTTHIRICRECRKRETK